MGGPNDEFPLLGAMGLHIVPTRGDGNCLFNALSDQIAGNQDQHTAIRARVIAYMREHADYYKQFIDVHPGGGIRRNPKRKNAGAYSSPAHYLPPSEADIDRVFESHLQSMSRGGTYGDNMEITAFASAYNTDVKIYQRDFAYMVTAGADEGARPVAHIAYHLWEHYSSIRNLDGPHTGLPEVRSKVLSVEEEERQRQLLAQTPYVQPWMIDVVGKSLPFLADKPTIKRAIEAAKGDIDTAVSALLDAEEYGSASSQQESSSVERDHDSDEENSQHGPNKKRDRRMSKATRGLHQNSAGIPSSLSQPPLSDGSQDSYDSEASSSGIEVLHPTPTQLHQHHNAITTLSPHIKEQSSPSGSQSPSSKPSIKLKLHPPKPPESIGKTQQQQQHGPRLTARERKEVKKQQQKAARKERSQLAARSVNASSRARSRSPSVVGLALRQKGLTETPPVETLRTLYI